jgi:hypothetical protein
MLWALDKAYDPAAPVAVPNVDGSAGGIKARDFAIAATRPGTPTGNAVNGLLSANSQGAANVLWQYSTGAVVAPAVFAQQRKIAASEAKAAGGTVLLTARGRAAAAVAAAFDCADGDNIDAADLAWSLATEAANWDATKAQPTWSACWTARKTLANSGGAGGDVWSLFRPGVPPGSTLVNYLATKYAAPPPWAKNTDHSPPGKNRFEALPPVPAPAPPPHKHRMHGIVSPAATTPPSNWIGTTSKSGYPVWQAFGTDDDGTPTGRAASVTDANGNQVASGTYISPPANSGYQWGYQFLNLPVGQTVSVNVQWTYPPPTLMVSQGVAAVVTNAN